MGNFNPPFAEYGDRRIPTVTERSQGLPCGPADRALFNDLWHRVEAEIGHVIAYAGITQTDDRYTLLREAIQALIGATLGGGDDAKYVMMDQARARLPIFPEVTTADGKMVITSPASGQVRIAGGDQIVHRGIYPVTSSMQDFTVDVSRTYHLRWGPADGFRMCNLSDPAYNPALLDETHPAFDTSYDSMLAARVTTNSANVPSITILTNKARLIYTYERSYLLYPPGGLGAPGVIEAAHELIDINFARTPLFVCNGFETSSLNVVPASISDGTELNITPHALTRYAAYMYAFSWSFVHLAGGRPKYIGSFIAN